MELILALGAFRLFSLGEPAVTDLDSRAERHASHRERLKLLKKFDGVFSRPLELECDTLDRERLNLEVPAAIREGTILEGAADELVVIEDNVLCLEVPILVSHMSAPVAVRTTTVAEAGGETIAPGGGLA